jgi:hypothetical protein
MQTTILSELFPYAGKESLEKTLPIAYKWAENFGVLPEHQETFVLNYFKMIFSKRSVWFRSLILNGVEYFIGCINSDLYIFWDGSNIFFYEASGQRNPNLHEKEEALMAFFPSKNGEFISNEHTESFMDYLKELKYCFYHFPSEKMFSPWKLLRKKDKTMSDVINSLAKHEKSLLFCNIPSIKDKKSDFFSSEKSKQFSNETRMTYGFIKNREEYYHRLVDYILLKIRGLIPKEIISTLWYMHLHDARYAHWILSGKEEQSPLYRMQALRTQSLLLPLVLSRFHAFYPVKRKQTFIKDHKISRVFNELRDRKTYLQEMVDAIDQGKAWQPLLSQNIQALFKDIFRTQSETLAVKSFDIVIKKSTKLNPNSFLSLPFIYLNQNFLNSVRGWFHVSVGLQLGERQPTNRKEWKRFLNFTKWCLPNGDGSDFEFSLDDVEGRSNPPDFVQKQLDNYLSNSRVAIEHYLKGTPVRWKDDYWKFLDHEDFSRNFADTIQWLRDATIGNTRFSSEHLLSKDKNKIPWFKIPFARFLNIHDDMHIHQRRIINEVDEIMIQKYGEKSLIQWARGLPAGTWIHNEYLITELNTQRELVDEGRAMSHCVGGYVNHCCTGKSRIYSVRTLDGMNRHSTFELQLRENSKLKRIVVHLIQNHAHGNTSPSDSVRSLVQKFTRLVNAKQNKLKYNFHWPSSNAEYRPIEHERDALYKKLLADHIASYKV